MRQGIPSRLSKKVLKANIGDASSNIANVVDPAVAAALPIELGTSGSWAEAREDTATVASEPSVSHAFRMEAADHI